MTSACLADSLFLAIPVIGIIYIACAAYGRKRAVVEFVACEGNDANAKREEEFDPFYS